MIDLKRTDSDNDDFKELVRQLDAYLTIVDGDEHAFYDQYNKLDGIRWVVVAYHNGEAVGCGAIKQYNEQKVELKRMFVDTKKRGQGIAQVLLKELEQWAAELNFAECILETGKRQVEAIRLYTKADYKVTENYGQYAGVENSVCMRKILTK